MEIILEVSDKDAPFILEMLKRIKRVKVKTASPAPSDTKEQFLVELQESVEYVKKVRKGLVPTRSARELLDEL